MSNPAPSVPAGGHEMRDYYSNQDPPRSLPHTAPSITPYLGLRARLSQVWFNRWTILLLLVLARTLIAISGINNDLASARREALSACSGVESLGSAMASMPHYMSQGVNELAASGVEKAVHGLEDMTLLAVTGVEEIVVFVIDTMTSTYTCLITMAVNGSVATGVDVIESAQKSLSTDVNDLGQAIASTTGDFETAYNKFITDLTKIGDVFGTSLTPPKLDLSTQMTTLKNLQLPKDLTPALDKIKADMPSFQQVQNFTNNAIRFPFEEVKGLISGHLGNYTFDRSVFPVPEKKDLTFCSDNNGINDFFDDLVHLAAIAKTIFIGFILAAAILVCIPMAFREIRRWRTMQERSELVGSQAHDPLDVVYIVSRPYTATAGIKAGHVFKMSRRQILTRWVIAYATSEAALFVLALALAGLFSILCQIILLKTLEKEVPDLTNRVGAFADKVLNELNNASTSWAHGTNGVIDSLNHDINNDMLGWVNITTGALNDTLNLFVNGTMEVLNDTFGGTVLYQPILDVLDCLVLFKIQGIEKAITWISDNAHVSYPTLPVDMFSLGAAASIASNNTTPSDSFLSLPGDQASDEISAAVVRFTNRLESAIRTEAIVAGFILLVWVIIVLIAVIRALTLWFRHDKLRGQGGIDHFRADPPSHPHDEFDNVPLDEMRTAPSARAFTPAPAYSRTMSGVDKVDPFHNEDYEYPDQKTGYAGQRDISSQSTMKGNGRIVSSQGEVFEDFKR